ncbi:MAG: DUF3800 domain-containing protein [Candidatus Margulisbacteria bacterium]|nr:DUF3800 domain-containing protein [Candidatus Margulisiibacteriota bacterium]MBU1616679.1 DUF3800 domain-containing protein [Candidatus Margulisiibacteriota bacterium]
MWYLYLDESGDLGFDFVNKKPSKYFTIAILAIQGVDNNRQLINAVKKTLDRKLNGKRVVLELKGSSSVIEIKKYFYKLIENIPFAIFSLSLNKKRVYESLTREKERVYNYVARKVLDQIHFEKAAVQVNLIADKCKGKREIKEFNRYIEAQLRGRLNPKVPLNIRHADSTAYKGIQAADLFSWGIFRSYERKDFSWYDLFKKKVRFNEQYL